jgi:hypothetical protein
VVVGGGGSGVVISLFGIVAGDDCLSGSFVEGKRVE